ncbi:hypothetical protein AAC387_Pa03g1628 [Persea americana]
MAVQGCRERAGGLGQLQVEIRWQGGAGRLKQEGWEEEQAGLLHRSWPLAMDRESGRGQWGCRWNGRWMGRCMGNGRWIVASRWPLEQGEEMAGNKKKMKGMTGGIYRGYLLAAICC